MDTYAHGYGSTGHYAKPGTHVSYCGHELQHTPNTAIAARVCLACAKAEQRDRAAAEQVAASRRIDGPTLAERANVRYATVGTGRRVHYSGNDETLCGREITAYISGEDLLTTLNKSAELCARCINAAEQREYARTLAASSPLAAAVGFATTVEQTDAERAKAQRAADAEITLAAEMVTEAEATAGTWRGEWIGEQDDDALFAIERDAEQGALFTG